MIHSDENGMEKISFLLNYLHFIRGFSYSWNSRGLTARTAIAWKDFLKKEDFNPWSYVRDLIVRGIQKNVKHLQKNIDGKIDLYFKYGFISFGSWDRCSWFIVIISQPKELSLFRCKSWLKISFKTISLNSIHSFDSKPRWFWYIKVQYHLLSLDACSN